MLTRIDMEYDSRSGGLTRERYLTSQLLRPSQAIGSPFVGQSGEAREPPGKRYPSKSRTSGIGPPNTRAGGVGKENANTPKRLKLRAAVVLEP